MVKCSCIMRPFVALLSVLLLPRPLSASDNHPGKEILAFEKATTLDHDAPFLINNVFNYYRNNGSGSFNWHSTDNEGFEFPKGTGKHTTYQEGIIWGGYHKGRATPKVGGSAYRQGLHAGKILIPGSATTEPVADDPSLPKYRVFRVRPDVGPATPFTFDLEALLEKEEVAITKHYQPVTAQSIYDQYVRDWIEWPAVDGAPFWDLDGNGIYNPSIDIPGIPGADQTLWYVANDVDSVRVARLSGSPPIGFEVQKTIWGYRAPHALANCIFLGTRLINRSGARVDSMYIAQWADTDVGDAGDDYVGSDTLLSLGYAYNGYASDATYGVSCPAVGFALLSGPLVRGTASDSAIVELRVLRGYRSLPPSSITMFSDGSALYRDPIQGTGGDVEWYCLLRGRIPGTCGPYIDPTTGQPSRFYASGDPATGTGWVDGPPVLTPQDRRVVVSAGPFTFADGDTQEIVVAHFAAKGPDRIASVVLLKEAGRSIVDAYREVLRPRPPLKVSVTFPSGSQARIALRLDGTLTGLTSALATIRRRDGSVVRDVALLDDGLHADGIPGDHVFGEVAQVLTEPEPVDIDLRVTDTSGSVRIVRGAAEGLTIAGNLLIEGPVPFSENLYQDGRANPGENIRFGLQLTNQTSFTLRGLTLALGRSDPAPLLTGAFPAGGTWEHRYDPADARSYLTLNVPASLEGTTFLLPLIVTDSVGNSWSDTLLFPAAPSRYVPVPGYASNDAGSAYGNFGILAVDRRSVQNHRYLIRAFSPDSAGGPVTISLEDSTDAQVLLSRHEIPDALGHNMPLTEGFKIVRGTISVPGGTMRGWAAPSSGRFWTYVTCDGLLLEGFYGAIGNAFDHWPSGGVAYERQKDVHILFAGTDSSGRILNPASPRASLAYRYLQNANLPAARPEFAQFIRNPGPGYAYQDYSTVVPFAVYDVDTIPRRRLMVGYLENNVPGGTVNGRYWPPGQTTPVNNTSVDGPREWFFIFDLPYSTTPSPALEVDLSSTWTPMMWFGTPGRRSAQLIPADADSFLITTWHAPQTGDVWSFNPVTIFGGPDGTIPSAFEVSANYPNPFNAGTTIKYALPFDARVIVRIYNILGQQVRLLSDGNELEGYRFARWDGKNDRGESVGSGVYLYRLQALSMGENARFLAHVGKMVVLR